MKSLLKRELLCGQRRFTSKRRVRRLKRRARGLRFEWLEQRTLLASDITILNAGVGTLDGFLGVADGTLTTADGGAVAGTLSRAALEGVGAGVNIDIAATTSITFEDLSSPLALQTGTGNSAAFNSGTGALSFTDVIADSLTTAGGAIALTAGTDMVLGSLDSGGGSIMVFANNALSVADIDAGAGTITISANQDALGTNDFTQFAGAIITTNQTSGAVSITVNTAAGGTGGANLRAINAGTTGGVVAVATNGGAIFDEDAADTTNITSFQATLSGQFIGAGANPLDTAVNVLTTDTSATNGNQALRETSGLTELNLNAGNSGDINLTLVAGAIQSADAAADIAGDRVALVAVTGIGTAANRIGMGVGFLEAETDTGGIFIVSTVALEIGGVNLDLDGLKVVTSGDIDVVNEATITLADTDGTATILAGATSGNVSLIATGIVSDVLSAVDQDAISAPGGNITVIAGRDIAFGVVGSQFDNDVRASGSVSFTAGRDILLDGFADIASDNFGQNTGGNVNFLAGRNISLLAVAGTDAGVVADGTAYAPT